MIRFLFLTPPAPTEPSPLSLHDALPISRSAASPRSMSCDRHGSTTRRRRDEFPLRANGASASLLARATGRSQLIDLDRKSTRLNSSHEWISYAVFCLQKKKYEAASRD